MRFSVFALIFAKPYRFNASGLRPKTKAAIASPCMSAAAANTQGAAPAAATSVAGAVNLPFRRSGCDALRLVDAHEIVPGRIQRDRVAVAFELLAE